MFAVEENRFGLVMNLKTGGSGLGAVVVVLPKSQIVAVCVDGR